MNKIRVMIADGDPQVRDGLQTVLDLEKDIEVIGSAGDGREALKMTELLMPDVVLLDLCLPVMGGAAVVKMIKEKSPQSKVIMLTVFDDRDHIANAMAGGTDRLLLKDIRIDRLVDTVRTIGRGKKY